MTQPAVAVWPSGGAGYERSEVSAIIGSGDDLWARATRDLLDWRVKTASGFTVDADGPVAPGARIKITARVLGITVVEPVEVVAVVDEPDRVGFAYRTLPGHPVSGEEAFILRRDDGLVRLTIRSLTRPAPQQPWRSLFPLLRFAQRVVRRRYLRALR
ncbi:DUF1990 family protein [Microlunatus speluncae]|uniref:DUF1990 family protein n=1 Tax=Microlunatus speluncae TaxID=2594267 RepID=UPI0012661138|nr:DUF1990 domain-containing protein [Microlunatus speluncae]